MSTPTEWEKGKNLCSYTLKKAIGCVCRPASELVWPVGLGRWLAPCMWHWSGRTSNTVLSFGVFSTRRTCSCFSMCREEQGSWWRDWETKIVRDGWGRWGCLVWRGGGWGEASLRGGLHAAARGVPVSLLSWEVTEHKETVPNCSREGLGWLSGKISSWKGWSGIGTGWWWGPHPGCIYEMRGCGAEGRGLVVGLRRSGWCGDPEGLFQPKPFYNCRMANHKTFSSELPNHSLNSLPPHLSTRSQT